MQEYQLTLNDKRIVWGKAIDIEPLIGKYPGDSIRQGVNAALDWNLPAGIYRAKEIVMELDKMLEAMLVQLGEPVNSDPAVLLDSLQANLAISGRVSSLPLGPLALEDKAGAEITAQAVRIGEQLVSWAREINAGKKTLAKYGPETLGKLEFRSHCYGHALIPEAIAQVWGPFGGPRVMQIYNEYLHQFVLLRDALLPFANWEEVPFEVKEYAEFKGLRFLEPAREIFNAITGEKVDAQIDGPVCAKCGQFRVNQSRLRLPISSGNRLAGGFGRAGRDGGALSAEMASGTNHSGRWSG